MYASVVVLGVFGSVCLFIWLASVMSSLGILSLGVKIFDCFQLCLRFLIWCSFR